MKNKISIIGLALLLLVGNANAVPADTLRDQLDELISRQLLLSTGDFEPPADARKEDLLNLLETDPRVAEASELTPELVSRVVLDNVVQYRVTVDEARSLVSHYTEDLDSTPSPQAVSQLIQLVLPYAFDAGVCNGDPMGPEGATCAFAFAPAGSVTGSLSGQVEGTSEPIPIPVVDPDSLLFEVLSGCGTEDDRCRELALPLLGSDGVAEAPGLADAMAAALNTMSNYDYAGLLSLIGIGRAAAQNYTNTWSDQRSGEKGFAYQGFPMRLAYGYGYYVKLRCGISAGFGCDLWGEVTAVGNLKYLIAGSDMMMAVLPFALHCPASCFFSGLSGYAWGWVNDRWLGGQSFDAKSFAASMRDSVQLRNAGSYSRHTARGSCGVIPMPHETRPTHTAYKAWAGTIPYGENYDMSPHTSFQVPTIDPLTPLLSTNMDPMPTRAWGELPGISCNPLPVKVDFVWNYDFLLVASWNFNVMFSGLDNANAINYCGADQFWQWHGARGSGKKGLPALTWTFAYAGGHPPYFQQLK